MAQLRPDRVHVYGAKVVPYRPQRASRFERVSKLRGRSGLRDKLGRKPGSVEHAETYAASSGPSNLFRLTASVRMNCLGLGIAIAAAYGGPPIPPPA
jgi:hypothetical protein